MRESYEKREKNNENKIKHVKAVIVMENTRLLHNLCIV